MSGPNIQAPSPNSPIVNVQTDGEGRVIGVDMTPSWAAFFQLLQQNAFVCSRNGPTTERPTSSTIGRFVGMAYFDTTLGLPVFLKHASSSVWVNGAGAVV